MADIQDFIQSAASSLGVGEDVVGKATGGLLGALKDNVDGGDFSELLGKVSGAEGLISGSSGGGGIGGMLGGLAGGGGIGGMLGAATSALGGGGGGLGALASLAGSGLSADKIGPLASLFMKFVKSSAGEALVSKLLSQMPDLKNLVD